MDKVSVIIPTYKRSGYLVRAIASVLEQTYTNIEIIVVDDNGISTEAGKQVQQIMQAYANDPRVYYLQNETNTGGALARNAGIFVASGTYISFLDDDDEYMPEKTEVQLAFMQANGLDACLMDLAGYDEAGQCIGIKRQAFPEQVTKEKLLVQHILHHFSGTPTFMFQTDMLRAIGGFPDVPAGHEYFLILRAIEAGFRIGYLPEVHVHGLTHKGERLSTGPRKMQALHLVLASKREYFPLLTTSQKRYVLCKHHGTLFYLHYLEKRYLKALYNIVISLFYSPKGFIDSYKEKKGRFYAK